ncbi:hypothetical protein niasHT_021136 [Heterodera trifolii]|uniref:RRM domain-containing protein n=1 Tax=Heterodera trifolii TaxID=157864 RepID=A0ABD2JF29_9BILA
MHPQQTTHRGPGIKQWRLIIRNLSFNTTVNDLRQRVETFGHILEIILPKCKDKRFPDSSAGFCFVQFSRRKDAEEAKKGLNFTELNGRKVAVDWAIDKDNYITKIQEEKKHSKSSEMVVKTEPKIESEEESDGELEIKNEKDEEESEGEENGTNDTTESIANGKTDKKPTKKEANRETKAKTENKKPMTEDSAVTEGRVVFLRNMPFTVDNEKLKNLSAEFGAIRLAICCRNKDTGDPSGTAFVHFQQKEGADNFLDKLTTEDGVLFDGRRIYGHRAVQRNEAKKFNVTDKKPVKDKRNLYLMRTSLLRPGTALAKGMSEEDAKLRQRMLEVAKTKLKNLTMFVSPNRLVIHNIPFSWKDDQLKSVCSEAAGDCPPTAISECRIMRQLKGQNEKGRAILGKSSGFGFVTFTEHTLALNCLRKLNNNPTTFSDERRPIVEFSIENLNALRVKERRQQKETKSEGNEEEKQQTKNRVGNAEALEKTKREMMAGGKKWLPKKLGTKIRHKKQQNGLNTTPEKRRGQTKNKPGSVKTQRKRKTSRGTDTEKRAKRKRTNQSQ